MNSNTKKFLVVFGGGILLFWAFTKIKPFGSKGKSKSLKSTTKTFTEEQKKNALVVVKAYQDAKASGEPQSFLDEMNAEFAKTYGMRVLSNKANGTFFASDLEGNKIS